MGTPGLNKSIDSTLISTTMSPMKLSVGKFFAPFLAGLIFTGCASSNDPSFLDNPDASSAIASPGEFSPHSSKSLTPVARFHVGETVTIAFSGLPGGDLIAPHQEPIKEDGTVTLPYLGPVVAAGKTAGELQNDIHDLYVPKYYVRLTVTVTPGDLIYFVRGEVKSPGREIYVGETTVSKAITSAGDFTDFASHTVWLIRANGQRVKVNVDKALENSSKDPLVYPGDQVVVPRRLF
jgi:polysaccharide export outer membrane protein